MKIDFDYELDENGNPTIIIPMANSSKRHVDFYQTRDKFYHEDLFSVVEPPTSFV